MRTIPLWLARACATSLVLITSLLAACATPPKEPAQLGCDQLKAEIRATERGRQLALEKQEDEWKFVTPVAVAGVHIASKSAVSDADRWLAALREQSRLKGCAHQA
jgi:hypothetical protein